MGSTPEFLTEELFTEWKNRGVRSLNHHGKPGTMAVLLANKLMTAWEEDDPKAEGYSYYLILLYQTSLDEFGECTDWWKLENMFWSFAIRFEPMKVPADEAEILEMAQDFELNEWGVDGSL